MPRKNLFNAYSSYRKNPLDTDQRGAVIQILVDRVDLTEAQANKVADRIDQQLEAAGYDELPSVEYFNQLFRGIVKKIVDLKKEKESKEPDFEPAVDYEKPLMFKGRLDTPEDAINAISFMVDVLHDEGPVKGGGASQKERSNRRRRPSRSSRRRSTRRNPYRAAAPVRGYRTNPFLPSDQDPLSIYRARLNRPGKAPLTEWEHLKAARLLRSHVKGMQNPPDFDKAQIQKIITILTRNAQSKAKRYDWNLPKEDARLGPNDYLIVHPESGSVRYEISDGLIAGLLAWKWNGGSEFEIRFPYYEDPDAEDTEAIPSEEVVTHLLLAPPAEKNVKKKELLNVYRFAEALQEKGYRAEVVERVRGQYMGIAIRCETSAGKLVAMAFIQGGKTLGNKSMQEFGARLGVAWRTWGSVGDENVINGLPSGSKSGLGTLTPMQLESVLSYYSVLTELGVPGAQNIPDLISSFSSGSGSRSVDGSMALSGILGAAQVIEAVKGKTDTIIGLPVESEDHPIRYIYNAKAGESVVRLPAGCLPFALIIEGKDCSVYIGVKPGSGAIMQDSLSFKKAFEYRASGSSGARLWPQVDKDTKSKGAAKPLAIKYKTSGSRAKAASTVDFNRAIRFPLAVLGRFAQGLDNIVRSLRGWWIRDESYGLFSGSNPNFYELKNRYDNAPKVFEDNGSYLFLPVAVAIYRGMLGLGLSARTDTDSFGDTSLTLALSEASPTPFIAEGQVVPVGAGRIDSVEVKSLATGKKVTAPGLSKDLKKAIKTLLPPPSFQYRFYETVAGKVGEKAKRVRRSFKPYPYQKIGIAFVHAAMGRAMIGDEMGLGKTIQALGALSLDPSPTTGQSMLPALIICPASVVGSWLKECKRWLPHLSVVEAGQTAKKADISVMSWGMVSRHWQKHEGKYNTVIVDEAHYGKRLYKKKKKAAMPTLQELTRGKVSTGKKSPYTMRTFGMVRICQSSPHSILLSGTLMENGGADALNLWTYLHALDPERFPSIKSFYETNFDNDGLLRDVIRFRQDFNQYHIRRMKSTVGEQVNLGCLYDPSYGKSDPGCAGSEDEVEVIEIRGVDEDAPRSNRRRSRKKTRRSRRNGLALRRMRKNSSSGYLRVGKTKRIIKGYLEFTSQQTALYDSIQQGMVARIAQAKIDNAIKQVVGQVTKGGKPDLTKIPELVATMNAILAEQDPTKIAAVALAVYHYLRQQIGRLKIPNAIEWVADSVFVDKEPCIVWVDQRKVAFDIAKGLDAAQKGGSKIKYAMVIGGVPKKKRTQIVDQFQKGEIDVIIASKAMREGVTLTRCNRALFVELWWVGAWMSQAEDRIFRIGQKRDCEITYLLAPNTIDDNIWDKVAAKKATQSMVFGSEQFKQGTEDVVAENVKEVVAMSDEERKKRDDELKAEIEKIQSDIDSGDLSAEDQEEAEDEAEQLEGIKMILDVTGGIMEDMLAEAKDREDVGAISRIQISEQEVTDALKEMGLKEVSYSLTRKGANWADEFILKKSYSAAITALGKLSGVSLTAARRDALAALEDLQNEGTKATTQAIKMAYENGPRLVKALIGLIESPNRKVRETLTYKGGVALNTNQQAMLTAMQEIAGTSTTDKLSLGQIQEMANRNLASIGRKGTFGTAPVKKALAALIQKGLIDKEEKAMDFRQNPRRNNSRKMKAIQNALSKPLPAKLKRAIQRNKALYGYNTVQNKALDLAVNLPSAPIQQSVESYNELADLMEQIEAGGGQVPKHIEKIAANTYRTLSKVYKG